mmetsp:Transcript_37453/g.65484  ORF Transcript_37453/g.65484 Transcript_37453/m.65484 type:complete len:312 (-) Transcript_37453:389-1324(-)
MVCPLLLMVVVHMLLRCQARFLWELLVLRPVVKHKRAKITSNIEGGIRLPISFCIHRHAIQQFRILEPVADGVRDLPGVGAEVAVAALDHVGDVALLLARQEGGEHAGQARDGRLRDGAWARLGDDAVHGAHPLVHVLHEAVDHHVHVRGPPPPLQRRPHLLVLAAHHHHLRLQVGLLAEAVDDGGGHGLQASHAVAAAHHQHRALRGPQAQLAPQLRLRALRRPEALTDGQAVLDDLAVLEAAPLGRLVQRVRGHKHPVGAGVEPGGVRAAQIRDHGREGDLAFATSHSFEYFQRNVLAKRMDTDHKIWV